MADGWEEDMSREKTEVEKVVERAGIMTMIKLQNAPMLYLVQKVTSLVKI